MNRQNIKKPSPLILTIIGMVALIPATIDAMIRHATKWSELSRFSQFMTGIAMGILLYLVVQAILAFTKKGG